MTEHDSPDPRHASGDDALPSPAAGQDLMSLLDLHRRGVIEDGQFADLSRNLTGTTNQRPARRRRAAAVVAGAAALVLAAAGISWSVLPGSDRSSVELAAQQESTESSLSKAECYALLYGTGNSGPDRTDEQIGADMTAGGCGAHDLQPVPLTAPKTEQPVAAPVEVPVEVPATAPSPRNSTGSSATAAPSQEPWTPPSPSTASRTTVAPPAPQAPAAPAPLAEPVPVAAPQPTATVNCSAFYTSRADIENRHQAQMANHNIAFNRALNSGNLDEAARLSNNAQAYEQAYNTDMSRLRSQYPGC